MNSVLNHTLSSPAKSFSGNELQWLGGGEVAKQLLGLLLTLLCFPAGKSALHWAAAVNNVEATLVLLKNGANRDMQDNKVQCGSVSKPVLPNSKHLLLLS